MPDFDPDPPPPGDPLDPDNPPPPPPPKKKGQSNEKGNTQVGNADEPKDTASRPQTSEANE